MDWSWTKTRKEIVTCKLKQHMSLTACAVNNVFKGACSGHKIGLAILLITAGSILQFIYLWAPTYNGALTLKEAMPMIGKAFLTTNHAVITGIAASLLLP